MIRPAPRAALAGLLLVLASCGGAGPDSAAATIGSETFIATYVDLRASALRSGEELTDEQRAEVLERHGVTPDQLLAFVEVHGPDVEFMKEVWDEVEARLDAERILVQPEPEPPGGG